MFAPITQEPGAQSLNNAGRRDIRCRYCIEGGNFKLMIGRGEGDWFMCARCGHLAMPKNPLFTCTCAKCVELEPLRSKRVRPKPL
jgi:hypothetical protein